MGNPLWHIIYTYRMRGRLKLRKKMRPFKLRMAASSGQMECSQELLALMSCYESNDMSSAKCRAAQKQLMSCVASMSKLGKQHSPTINYHLQRLSRQHS